MHTGLLVPRWEGRGRRGAVPLSLACACFAAVRPLPCALKGPVLGRKKRRGKKLPAQPVSSTTRLAGGGWGGCLGAQPARKLLGRRGKWRFPHIRRPTTPPPGRGPPARSPLLPSACAEPLQASDQVHQRQQGEVEADSGPGELQGEGAFVHAWCGCWTRLEQAMGVCMHTHDYPHPHAHINA